MGLMKKRGNVAAEGIIVIIIFMFIGIGLFVGGYSLDLINTSVNEDIVPQNNMTNYLDDYSSNYASIWDNIYLLAIVLIMIFVIGSAFLIDTNPIFFVISIVLLIVLLMTAATLGNSFETMMGDAAFGTYADNFPVIVYVSSHLIEIILATIFLLVIVLYGKTRISS